MTRGNGMGARSLRGKAVVAGIGETPYYKHGHSPDSEFKLALKAILAAANDAGINPKDIDGFASYSNDRNDPSRLAAALGTKELRFPTCSGVVEAEGRSGHRQCSGGSCYRTCRLRSCVSCSRTRAICTLWARTAGQNNFR